MSQCVCQSGLDYSICCEPFHLGRELPSSPELLMRSRYSAYVKSNIHYISETMSGKAAEGFDKDSAKEWAERVQWIGLCVHGSKKDSDVKGYVEFTATFIDEDKLYMMHELSEFHYMDGRWLYVDGRVLPTQKINRNDRCPCGNEKKFKHCHGKSY